MKNNQPSVFTRLLGLTYSGEKDLWLKNSSTLRKVVGTLGMMLPVFLFVFLWIDSGLSHALPSISHYYYTRASSVFVALMSLLAIFLIVYKGEEPVDFFVSILAGVAALCVVLFPTGNLSYEVMDDSFRHSVTTLRDSSFREKFHYASAGVFLLSLAFMSAFLFTKTDKTGKEMTRNKKIRNIIYRGCAIMMVLAIVIILLGLFQVIPRAVYEENHLTFWMEVVAVESFGISWMIKGETLFRDRKVLAQ